MKFKSNPLRAELDIGKVWHLTHQRGIAMKREALAAACGISRYTLYKMLKKDITHITIGALATLCQALDCSFDEVIIVYPNLNGGIHEPELVPEPK